MATAQKIIEGALSQSGIRAAETPVTASELQDGLDELNDMIAGWDTAGILPGVMPVENATDEVNAPRYAVAALKSSLSMRLLSLYGRDVPPTLAVRAAEDRKIMFLSKKNLSRVELPPTLSMGSGNREEWDSFDQNFFPQQSKENF